MSEDVVEQGENTEETIGGRTKVEILKESSRHLRGSVKETLESWATHFSEDEYQLLKFHGVYQQEDRDARVANRGQKGRDKDWIMMIRAKIPGGVLTADQYLAFDEIAQRYANNTLRLTTRQCFQLHHIGKYKLKQTIKEINDALITTLGACGDVERNVMACPAPDGRAAVAEVQRYARLLSDHSLPRTSAYHEIWLDHEKILSTEQEREPLYGETYLPRKFKTGIAIEGDNCIDVYSQDIGIVAHIDSGQLSGFTILVGGGMGMTHTDKATHPCVAQPICFVKPELLLDAFLTILRIQRDNGDRGNRRHARMKYLVEERGIEWFKGEMERRLNVWLDPPRQLRWDGTGDHVGWEQQTDGRWYLGIFVENGRIQDSGGFRYKTGFRALVQKFRPGIRLTATQNVLFTHIEDRDRAAVEALLRDHGVLLEGEFSRALRHSMACPAMPTCGLALAESERSLPPVVRRIETILAELGLGDERMSIRMTGCPNGCARPFLGDIGFVGRTPGKYQLYVGGDFEGTRLNELLADLVPGGQLADRLRPLFAMFRDERLRDEGFGDFCHRIGVERLRSIAFPDAKPAAPRPSNGHATVEAARETQPALAASE